MQQGEPSQTALHVAAARAAHLRYDPPPHLLVDDRAAPLLGSRAEALTASYADDGSPFLVENRLAIPLRARFAEDRLAAAYREGVRQLVVLGAGLDSYAFRRPAEQGELRIYEVDHPATQGWKRARITELGWELPDLLRFVPCDFETTALSEALRGVDFDRDAPALVTWLGVIYYLEPETARRALVDLHDTLAPGSEVVFDYQFPLEDLPARYQALLEKMQAYLEQVGEPHKARHRREALRELILGAGYSEALLPERAVVFERYIRPLHSRIPLSARFGLAVARR